MHIDIDPAIYIEWFRMVKRSKPSLRKTTPISGAGRGLGASSGVLGVIPNILLDTNANSLLLNDVVISKELRDLLKRLAGRFRHEEEREDGGKSTENSEEQVGSPANLDDHLGDDNTDDEVCKPNH